MKAKHSIVVLSGLLVLMIGIGWAQGGSQTVGPSCPAVEDRVLQDLLQPTAWVRADWNANTSRWDIDCKQIDAIGNMPRIPPANAVMNAPINRPARNAPRRNANRP